MNYRDIAITAAQKAGDIHKYYSTKDCETQTKTSSCDLVTRADIEAERAITQHIYQYCPDHNILAEETTYEATNSPYTWIIDPLDGTNNFAHRLPIFSCSIALAYEQTIILGVIYDVSRNELFCAEKGKGSSLNESPIHVSKHPALRSSLLITGFYYDRGLPMKKTLKDIENFFSHDIVGIRRLGSAALDLCYIACGRATGFWEFQLSPWDFAAGYLLVHEAGGIVTNDKGASINVMSPSYIVASNGLIHPQMLSVLRNEPPVNKL